MAETKQIKEGDKVVYPLTHVNAIVDDNGRKPLSSWAHIGDIVIEQDTEELNVGSIFPNILNYKEFRIKLTLKSYIESGKRGEILFTSRSSSYNYIGWPVINDASYRTMYLLKIKIGDIPIIDSYGYIECHNNSWNNTETYLAGSSGVNFFSNSGVYPIDQFVYKFPFTAGDKLEIYGK